MKWVKLYLSKILWSKYIFGRPLGTLHRRCMSMPHWKWTPYSIALFCYVQCFMKLVLDQNNSTSILFWFSLFQTMNNNFWDVKWYKWLKIKKKIYLWFLHFSWIWCKYYMYTKYDNFCYSFWAKKQVQQ